MRSAHLKVIFIIALLLSLVISRYPKNVYAAESCTASISPNSVLVDSDQTFSFSVTNTGDAAIVYIRVTAPSGSYSLYNNGGIPSPWIVGASGQQLETYNGTVESGNTFDFSIGGNIGSNPEAAANWTVEMIATSDFIGCPGSLSTEITSGGDTTAPVLSEPSLSEITSTTATVTWTTDEDSNSRVDYGTTLSYGSDKSSALFTTAHSITLTGLTANTLYYYKITSTDESGNGGNRSGYNFNTAAAGLEVSPTGSTTPTPTGTSTSTTTTPTLTPTPTPIPVDKTPPRIAISTELESSYMLAPEIVGSASDNEIVSKIDYSTDGGENWLPVDVIENPDTNSTAYSFIPYVFEDGNYQIQTRAIDLEGNIGTSNTLELILDRLPPRVGGNLLSLGPQPLIPNENGVIVTMKGLKQKITLSSVGGATEIKLFVGDKEFDLTRSNETGLWSGEIALDEIGLYKLKTKAVDGVGNTTERDLNSILVVDAGRVSDKESGNAVRGGQVALYVKDPLINIWALWDGKPFGQDNPQIINDKGEYQFFLPAAEYYLQITSPGYEVLTSEIFRIGSITAFNADFELKEGGGLNLGFLNLSLTNFFSEKAEVVLKTFKVDTLEDELVGVEAPSFSLPSTKGEIFDLDDAKGRAFVLSFISTWSPLSIEQVPILNASLGESDIPSKLVSVQETVSKLSVFVKKGKYNLDIVVDADGELVEKYQIKSLPTHFFIDKKGVIKKVITGVLNEEEIENGLVEIR